MWLYIVSCGALKCFMKVEWVFRQQCRNDTHNISAWKWEHRLIGWYFLLIKPAVQHTMVFWLAFILLAAVFVLLVGLLIVLIWKKPFTSIAEWCSIVLPALVSFHTVFFVIPKVITEYLLNSEEEKYMSEIIKTIQNYDRAIVQTNWNNHSNLSPAFRLLWFFLLQ